jgi:membrane associated rhomboid family serine protease
MLAEPARAHEKARVSDAAPPPNAQVFEVRYGPEKPSHVNEPWSNNLQLTGSGTVIVGADAVWFSDTRAAPTKARRQFAMADIANVGFSEQENIVAVRTRNDDREVHVWMASAQDAHALLGLLPRTATPQFLEQQRLRLKFRENLRVIAPKAPVTPGIIGTNVVVFLLMLAAGASFVAGSGEIAVKFGANYGPLTWGGQPWRLITSAFVHFGIVHIAFNMYALHYGGSWTERLYGSARFGVIYLLSALSGSVVSSCWDATRLSAGASGAVFGVYGALLVFFLRRRGDIPLDLLKSVRSGAISLCVYSLAMGAVLPTVDNSAHIGGLLGGAASGWLLVRPFEPAARAVARPWHVAAVIGVVCAALAVLVTLAL